MHMRGGFVLKRMVQRQSSIILGFVSLQTNTGNNMFVWLDTGPEPADRRTCLQTFRQNQTLVAKTPKTRFLRRPNGPKSLSHTHPGALYPPKPPPADRRTLTPLRPNGPSPLSTTRTGVKKDCKQPVTPVTNHYRVPWTPGTPSTPPHPSHPRRTCVHLPTFDHKCPQITTNHHTNAHRGAFSPLRPPKCREKWSKVTKSR